MTHSPPHSVDTEQGPAWMKKWLIAAGVYNILFGAWAVLLPLSFFSLLSIDAPRYPQLWQCVGMIVGVYGLGYIWAASAPLRHWPIIAVGFLGKVFGPIGFVFSIYTTDWPLAAGWMNLSNDLIWLPAFAAILYQAFRYHTAGEMLASREAAEVSDSRSVYLRGEYKQLLQRSHESPVILVFLRHFGCVFCRNMLRQLAANEERQAELGYTLTIVHMASEERAREELLFFGLEDAQQISDPTCALYRRFGLGRGSFLQLFGLRSWIAGFRSLRDEIWIPSRLEGDGFQMPGAFSLECGKITESFVSDTASSPLPEKFFSLGSELNSASSSFATEH